MAAWRPASGARCTTPGSRARPSARCGLRGRWTLTRPATRARLYWTRAHRCSCRRTPRSGPSTRVFAAGLRRPRWIPPARAAIRQRRSSRARGAAAAAGPGAPPVDAAAAAAGHRPRRPASRDEPTRPEREVPLALASARRAAGDEGLRRARARRAARAATADARAVAGHAAAPHAACAPGAPRRPPRRARDAARQPPDRRRPGPLAAPPARAAPPAARRAVRHLRVDGALLARVPAVPARRRRRANAEAFVFATRLTRLTRALRGHAARPCDQRAAAAAPDWSGGTRIGAGAGALQRSSTAAAAWPAARSCVIVSDGWETGDPRVLAREMRAAAPARPPHRLGQPAQGGAAASRRATAGMAAALPHSTRSSAGTDLFAMSRGDRGDRSRR